MTTRHILSIVSAALFLSGCAECEIETTPMTLKNKVHEPAHDVASICMEPDENGEYYLEVCTVRMPERNYMVYSYDHPINGPSNHVLYSFTKLNIDNAIIGSKHEFDIEVCYPDPE